MIFLRNLIESVNIPLPYQPTLVCLQLASRFSSVTTANFVKQANQIIDTVLTSTIYVSVLFLAWYEFRFSQTPSSASTMPRSAESARFSSDPTRRSWSNSLQSWWSTATSENSKSSMTTALERSSWTLLEDSTRPVSSPQDSTSQSLTSRSGPTHSFHLVSSGE